MSKWLVRMTIHCPAGMSEQEHEELYTAESEHCLKPEVEPYLEQLYRLPGTTNNVGIWDAPDAETLHKAICSLPIHKRRFMTVTVEALAEHHNDPRVRARREAEAAQTEQIVQRS